MAGANIVKILVLCGFSATLAVLFTPLLTYFLYKHKLWRKETRRKTIDGREASLTYRLHKDKETKVPRLGGLLIWLTTIFTAFLFSGIARLSDTFWAQKLNFLSRDQTFVPLAILAAAAFLGLCDDILQIFGKGKYIGGGIKFTRRLFAVGLIGLVGGYWFYFKLGWSSVYLPFVGSIEIGFFYLILFVIVSLACWSGGAIDGLDGLAGGAFAIMFAAFAIIAFSSQQYNLASFCAVLTGTLLAFLWFNIPPARFYMGETGIVGLTSSLAVVSFLTDSVAVLPIIGGLLVIESASVILQLLSKRFFHRKIFLAAPIHYHLQAKGWAPAKITMRAWILGIIFAMMGVAVKLLG